MKTLPMFIYVPLQMVPKIVLVLFVLFVIGVVFTNCATVPIKTEPQVTAPGTLGDVLLVYSEWEGPVNPHDFQYWKVIAHRPCPGGYNDYHILLQNPGDGPTRVEIIIILHEDGEQLVLIWYKYDFNGVTYEFSITSQNQNKYIQVQPRGV